MQKSTTKLTIGCIVGTRPELIKMAPIIFKLQESSWAKVIFINTAQHRSLLDNLLGIFGLKPDLDLDCMVSNQSLANLTSILNKKLSKVIKDNHFDAILAAGDTTTVFVASLVAFYNHLPFGHVEAGLRTYDKDQPFPEEINRVLTAPLATWHFAPTHVEQENLERENIDASKIVLTGNPVIDTLYWILKNKPKAQIPKYSNSIIVTAHRRENFGKPMENICQAVIELSNKFKDINFVFPVHPNPNVQKAVLGLLDSKPRIHLLPPLRYDEFVHLMNDCLLVLTDSGGIQEEAPALKKPVLVLRAVTERPAIIIEGVGSLVGTEKEKIIASVSELLTDKALYSKMAKGVSPYGDGFAAKRIVNYLEEQMVIKDPIIEEAF